MNIGIGVKIEALNINDKDGGSSSDKPLQGESNDEAKKGLSKE